MAVTEDLEQSRAALTMIHAMPFNAEAPTAALAGDITPSEAHYVRSNFAVPAHAGTLEIGGKIRNGHKYNDSYTTTRGETLDVSAPGVLDNDCDPDVAVPCGGGEYRVAGPAAASDSNLQVGPSSVGTFDSVTR